MQYLRNKLYHSEKVEKAVFAAFLACVFFFSLRYGYGIIDGPKCFIGMAFFVIYFTNQMRERISIVDSAFMVLMLAYFFIGNYQHIFYEGGSREFDILPYTWTVPIVYILGKIAVVFFNKENLDNQGFIILSVMATGMYIQGLLNYAIYYIYDYKQIYEDMYYYDLNGPGNWRSFWDAATDGNRNKWNNGFLMIMGAVFFALLVRNSHKLFSILVCIGVVAALFISIHFKGRAVVVLIAFTFIVMALLYSISNFSSWTRKTWRKLIAAVSVVMTFIFIVLVLYKINFHGLATIYDNIHFIHREGGILKNVRLQMWTEGIKRTIELQKGGWDLLDLFDIPTPHNAWIEYARYYDVLVFLLIVIFLCIMIYKCVRLVLKHGNEYPVVYFAVSSVFIMFAYCMMEPTYIENQDMLLFFYFACGIVSGLWSAAESGDYYILNTRVEPNCKSYVFMGTGLISMAFLCSSYMDWWNDRMELFWPVIIPTIAYILGGFVKDKRLRVVSMVGVGVASVIAAIVMYIVSIKSEFIKFGLYTEPLTNNAIDKSVFVALLILPVSLAIGLIFYLIKINKVVASIIVTVVTGIGAYPYITDGRLVFIKEALKLQLGMKSGLQWIASKENYLGIRTSHSMWLDYARDYGMVVLGLLVVFEIWSIYCFVKMILNGHKNYVDYVLIVAFVLFNYQFMFEASAITSKYIFAMGLFVYGMITSAIVSGEEEQKKREVGCVGISDYAEL